MTWTLPDGLGLCSDMAGSNANGKLLANSYSRGLAGRQTACTSAYHPPIARMLDFASSFTSGGGGPPWLPTAGTPPMPAMVMV
jgi:hypothetical protein